MRKFSYLLTYVLRTKPCFEPVSYTKLRHRAFEPEPHVFNADETIINIAYRLLSVFISLNIHAQCHNKSAGAKQMKIGGKESVGIKNHGVSALVLTKLFAWLILSGAVIADKRCCCCCR